MGPVEDILAEPPQNISGYIASYKKIFSQKRSGDAKTTLKIALLSSFTITGMKETLGVKCFAIGIEPEIYVAPYNQFAQEILTPGSQFYQFKADLTVLFIDTIDLFGDGFFTPYRFSEEQRKKIAVEKYKELTTFVKKIASHSFGKIMLHNLRIPYYSPLGILENKQKFGFFEMIREINNKLQRHFRNDSQVFLFDYDLFCSKYGKANIMDNKMYYLGDFKLGFEYLPRLCEDYMAYIKPLTSRTKKCLVLDLDNTLWGGVIGEDGLKGIRLGPTPEGRPFLEFQKYILSLYEKGVLLAINSSNNFAEVSKVFTNHPHMILKKDHFAALEINWSDKISNMRSIAKTLNVGLDALVFIDDVKANREMIRKALPEVSVPNLPEDPADYVTALMEWNDFNTLQITDEDRHRNRLYAAEKKRLEHRKSATDLTQYLRDLKMVVTIAKADPLTIPRISQLTQKTNQFNMTTRRYLEEDIKKFSESCTKLVVSAKVEDKFGDNGITGAAIVRKSPDFWVVDTFLLSCRVIGRKIEEVLLAYLLDRARKSHAKFLVGEFIPTHKNTPAKDFYKRNQFQFKKNDDHKEIWEFDLSSTYRSPDFIEVLWKD